MKTVTDLISVYDIASTSSSLTYSNIVNINKKLKNSLNVDLIYHNDMGNRIPFPKRPSCNAYVGIYEYYFNVIKSDFYLIEKIDSYIPEQSLLKIDKFDLSRFESFEFIILKPSPDTSTLYKGYGISLEFNGLLFLKDTYIGNSIYYLIDQW